VSFTHREMADEARLEVSMRIRVWGRPERMKPESLRRFEIMQAIQRHFEELALRDQPRQEDLFS
jgi:hypothetical protein